MAYRRGVNYRHAGPVAVLIISWIVTARRRLHLYSYRALYGPCLGVTHLEVVVAQGVSEEGPRRRGAGSGASRSGRPS